jgi:polysaccharide chain length determinant protein (PEP-CTERM system associated)
MESSELNLKKYLGLFKKNKVLCIVSALAIMTGLTVKGYLLPNIYEARSTVFIEKGIISELMKGLTVTPSADEKIKVLSYALNSRTLIAKVLDELDLNKSDEAEQENQIKMMQDHTQIRIQDKEGLFVISFQDQSPKLARDYVNTLIRRYIEENTSSKREESYGAIQFVTEQLTDFKEKLQKSENAINTFKAGPGAIASMDQSLLYKDISDSLLRLDELRIRQAQLKTELTGLNKVSSAQSNILALQRRLQELQLHYTDSYPEIQSVKDDIRALKERLKSGQGIYKPVDTPEYEKVASELGALRQAESNLSNNIARNRDLLQRIPAAKAKYDDLERERNSQKNLFEALLARQRTSEVSKQVEVQNKSTVFRIVDPAVLPIKPVGPDRVRIILMGILAGIGGGLGLVLLKDQMDSTVKNVDMAKHFGFPVLAVIPRVEDPLLLVRQAKRDLKLCIAASAYFSLILAVLVSEITGVAVISKIISRLTS